MESTARLDLRVLPVRGSPGATHLYEAARSMGEAVLFDSSAGGRHGRTSFAVVLGRRVVSWHAEDGGDPFVPIEAALRARTLAPHRRWPFVGGLVGWFGYDARQALEVLPARHPRTTSLPDVHFAESEVVLLRDEATGEVEIAWLVEGCSPERAEAREALARRLAEGLAAPASAPIAPPPFAPEALVEPPPDDHGRRVLAAQAHIRAGDIYQANLARAWMTPRPPDPFALYRRLAARNPPDFGFFAEVDGEAILSISPERFLEVDGSQVVSRPIKGTARRGQTAGEDVRLARELLASGKDRAELAMIVDVLRNDLARVCQPGSVVVRRALELESFPTVHHLVAEVAGRLQPERGRVDLVRAAFPGGSITGAPRIRAMEIIDELEAERRGPYCGAAGYFGYDGRMDLNILIRAGFTGGDRFRFFGGGGITIDSRADAEVVETEHKVRAFVDALVGPWNPS